MENKAYNWKETKLYLGAKEIEFTPLEYSSIEKSIISHYEGNITILKGDFDKFISMKSKKLSNFQIKKMWKKLLRKFGFPENEINEFINKTTNIDITIEPIKQ